MDDRVVNKVAEYLKHSEWQKELEEEMLEEMKELRKIAEGADAGDVIPDDREVPEYSDYEDYDQFGGRARGIGPMLCLAAVIVAAAAVA